MADAEQPATNYGVFGVGNSLLDVSAEVGKEVLDQYDLKPGKFNFISPCPFFFAKQAFTPVSLQEKFLSF